MLASYATVARRAAALTLIAATVAVGLSAGLAGMKGLVGALVGVAIVAVFFGVSIAVVGRAAKVSPQAMMVAALGTFLVKIVALAFVVSALDGTTASSTRTVGFTAVACIVVWSVAQVVTAMRIRMLYVDDPDGNR
jgi:ATP synthase protein I